MDKKSITIKEVENGWVITYTLIGSGQEIKTVHTEKAGVKDRVCELINEEPDI